MDEFLELFKGQVSIEDIKNMPYKEAMLLKQVREERLRRRYEEDKNSFALETLENELQL